jgi:PAS domain S-box-containing protein
MARKGKAPVHKSAPKSEPEQPVRSEQPDTKAQETPIKQVIQAFYRVMDQITDQADSTSINNTVLDAASEITQATFGMIGEMDSDGSFQVVGITEKGKPLLGSPTHDDLKQKGIPFRGKFVNFMGRDKPHYVNGPLTDGENPFKALLDGHPFGKFEISNILVAPFKVLGKVQGAMLLANKPGGFSDNDASMMEELARLASSGRSKILALSAALRNTSDGIALMDRNSVLSMVNPALENMFLYTASELEGRSLLGIFLDPDTGSPLGEAIAGAVMNGTWSGEALGLRRDGTMFPAHLTVTAVEESTAPRTGFMLMVRDITIEKEAQEKARFYLETAEVMLVALDLEGRVTMINRKCEEVLGRFRGDVVGRDLFENCVPEAHREKARRTFDLIFDAPTQGPMGPVPFPRSGARRKEPMVEGLSFPILDSRGTERMVLWTHAPLKNHKGLVIGVLLSGSDVTEQRHIEEKLRASEEIYKAILRSSPDAITLTDLKGVITDCSTKALELFGGSDPFELIGKNSFELIAPEEHAKAIRGLERTLKDGTMRTSYHLVRKDGTVYPSELSTTVILDQSGNPSHFLGIIRDMSEKEMADSMLKEAEARYKTIFETSPVGIVRMRLEDGKPILANQMAAQNLGYRDVEALLDQAAVNPVIPHETVNIMLERLKRNGQLKDYEVEFKKVDGTQSRLLFNATITPGADYLDLFGLDITKVKLMESKLHEAERAFGGIMDATFLGFARFNIKDGRLTFANTRLAKRFGYETVEDFLKNVTSRDMFSDAQRMEIRERLIKDGVLPDFETQVRMRDGTKNWALTYSRLDKATGNVDVMTIDITRVKQAEQRLLEAEKTYKELFDSIPTAIAKIELATGKLIMANEAAAKMLGYSSVSELKDAFHNNKKLGPRFMSIQPLIEKDGIVKNQEYEVPRKDGTMARLLVTAIRSQENGLVTFFATDITESKSLENRLRDTEQLYRHLFENTPIGVSRLKLSNLEVIVANNAMLDIAGVISLDELSSLMKGHSFYPKEKTLLRVEELKGLGSMSNIEMEIRRPDGSKRIILVYATIDPTAGFLDSVVMDITRLKEAEARLSEAEGTYWQMFKASTVGQARIGLSDGKVQVCNEAFARMLGYGDSASLIDQFSVQAHVTDMDLWEKRVANNESDGKGVGWLPSPSNPPSLI